MEICIVIAISKDIMSNGLHTFSSALASKQFAFIPIKSNAEIQYNPTNPPLVLVIERKKAD